MQVVAFLGRIVLGLFFVQSGWHHLRDVPGMAQYAGSRKVPAPSVAVAFTGLMLLYSGLVLLAGTPALWASGLIVAAVALLGFNVGVHNFWTDQDPGTRQMNQLQFNKNLAIVGGLLALLAASPTVWSLHL